MPPPPRRGKRWLLVGMGVGAVVLVAAVLVVVVTWGPGSDLLERVPAALRDDCSFTEPVYPGATDSLYCRDGDGTAVTFGLFGTREAAVETYQRVVRDADPPQRLDGDCAFGVEAEHGYPSPADVRGRVVCVVGEKEVMYSWVDRTSRTVGRARADRDDARQLGKAWSTWVGIPGFPSGDEKKLMTIIDESTCARVRAETLETFKGVTTTVDCKPDSKAADGVSFLRFGTREQLDAFFLDRNEKLSTKKSCFSHNRGRGKWWMLTWNVGRLACGNARDGAFLEWTIESMLLYGRATGPDAVKLFRWWVKDSGPSDKRIGDGIRARAEPTFPAAAEKALLEHIPAESRVNCVRPRAKYLQGYLEGVKVTAIVCGPTPGAGMVVYHQFPDRASMRDDYGPAFSGWPDCTKNRAQFKGEHTYRRGGEVVGRLYCGRDEDGDLVMQWTDERFNIEVMAYEIDDPEAAIDWFRNGAGPA